jgi:hypothetical protein
MEGLFAIASDNDVRIHGHLDITGHGLQFVLD